GSSVGVLNAMGELGRNDHRYSWMQLIDLIAEAQEPLTLQNIIKLLLSLVGSDGIVNPLPF
ncbi:MAG: hypothetical protein MUP04_07470, partial [Anaerolineae bacterium]|nr:hypothetical protein [Anaerolineae bacterium]